MGTVAEAYLICVVQTDCHSATCAPVSTVSRTPGRTNNASLASWHYNPGATTRCVRRGVQRDASIQTVFGEQTFVISGSLTSSTQCSIQLLPRGRFRDQGDGMRKVFGADNIGDRRWW